MKLASPTTPPHPPIRPRLTALAALGASVLTGLLAAGALLTALAGPAAPAWAAPAGNTLNYPGGAPCDTSLQACLDGAAPGDTILVAAGSYTTSTLVLSQAVSLTGVSSATVILNALTNQRVLSVTGSAVDSSVVISGLTLAGGHVDGGGCPDGCGGALEIGNQARPSLSNLTIRDSFAGWSGGGVYAEAGSPLSAANLLLLNNVAGSVGGGLAAEESISVSGSLFSGNTCITACSGGGLWTGQDLVLTASGFISNASTDHGGAAASENGRATVADSLFRDNHCTQSDCVGGGLYSGDALTLTNVQFLSNTSGFDGGGAYTLADAVVSGSLFVGNRCTQPICAGGGLLVSGSLLLTSSTFSNNASDYGGGGAFAQVDANITGGLFQDNHCLGALCSGGGLDVENNLVLSGTRFFSNSSTSEGGGVFVFVGSLVTNTVFVGNHSLNGGALYQCEGGGWGEYANDLFAANTVSSNGDALYIGSPAGAALRFNTLAGPGAGAAIYVAAGSVSITDTLIATATIGIENDGGSLTQDDNLFSAVGAPYAGAIVGGGHSLTATIAFANPAAADYHLLRGSPAINAGVDAGLNFDIDGQPRPLLGGFDIGYDEYALWSVLLPLVRR